MAHLIDFETLTERQRIELAQAGDRQAFDGLVNAYYPRMVRTALRILRDQDDAADAVQQAFIAAWQNLDKFRGDAAFSTWLTRITINESFSVLRRRKRQMVEVEGPCDEPYEIGERGVPSPGEDPEQQLIRRETARLLRESMDSVKPVYRAAMELRLHGDLSVEEIAQRLRMPVNTVKVHLFRGRQSMKVFLEERMMARAA